MAFTLPKFKYLLETYPGADLAFLSKVHAFNKTLWQSTARSWCLTWMSNNREKTRHHFLWMYLYKHIVFGGSQWVQKKYIFQMLLTVKSNKLRFVLISENVLNDLNASGAHFVCYVHFIFNVKWLLPLIVTFQLLPISRHADRQTEVSSALEEWEF